MARYSGEDVEHTIPVSVGGRAELGLGIGSAGTRWFVVAPGVRHSGIDFGVVDHAMLDLAYREAIPGTSSLHPHWEAGLGAALIRLQDEAGEPLALHLGPRFHGALGLGFGRGKLRPELGLRASFTAATGSFDLDDVEIDDEIVGRFYLPSTLCLAATVGLRI